MVLRSYQEWQARMNINNIRILRYIFVDQISSFFFQPNLNFPRILEFLWNKKQIRYYRPSIIVPSKCCRFLFHPPIMYWSIFFSAELPIIEPKSIEGITSRQPTQHQLLKKFEELTSSNAWLQNRWMPDEEIVHSIKVHSDFAKTSSSSLNAAITKLCNFTSNCHKFDGGNTFLRIRGNFKIGSKRKRISFYFVKSTEDKVLIPNASSPQWPQIYNDFLQNAASPPPTITKTTETSFRKRMRTRSTVCVYELYGSLS